MLRQSPGKSPCMQIEDGSTLCGHQGSARPMCATRGHKSTLGVHTAETFRPDSSTNPIPFHMSRELDHGLRADPGSTPPPPSTLRTTRASATVRASSNKQASK
jgi:hypothetical protein